MRNEQKTKSFAQKELGKNYAKKIDLERAMLIKIYNMFIIIYSRFLK
nr:MAG TPA: hypothetical protein [Caudoviricetes sp.]